MKYLERLINHENLTTDETREAIDICLQPETTNSEISAFLTALRSKGETAEEIAGLVEALRTHSNQLQDTNIPVMDNCGTGGDGSNSFNISTTAAFVIAGCGVNVAKHGNRSISSKTGSADVLEHLGVSLALDKKQVKTLLLQNNIAFLFAPHVHPGMKRFMEVRKALKIPTIFNMIGPLTNPVQLDTQLMGIYRRDKLDMIARTLHQLGRKRAIVINGAGHMDEASLAGDNHITLLENGKISSFTIHPHDLGLPVYPNEAIRGGDTHENATILLNVLNGKKGPHFDTVLFNAALALFANGRAKTLIQGIEEAYESIMSMEALKRLNFLIDYSKHQTSEVI